MGETGTGAGTYDVGGPGRELAGLDVLKERLDAVVGVLTRELTGFIVRERLSAAIVADVDLDVVELALGVDELERVSRVAVHVVVADGRTAVREQNHDLVDRLRVLREVVLFACLDLYAAQPQAAVRTQNMSASFRWVWGSRFWVWMKWGNLEGSRMKKTGVLLNTQSRLPSSVLILIAKPAP